MKFSVTFGIMSDSALYKEEKSCYWLIKLENQMKENEYKDEEFLLFQFNFTFPFCFLKILAFICFWASYNSIESFTPSNTVPPRMAQLIVQSHFLNCCLRWFGHDTLNFILPVSLYRLLDLFSINFKQQQMSLQT